MNCLNCDHVVDGKFCSNCGQKISTKRFSLVSIFDYAVLTGIFSIDKGILFTTKELFTTPGHSIREYIQGKRVKFFNAFSLLLLLLALSYFLEEFTAIKLADITAEGSKEFANLLEEFMKDYPRIIYLLNIPLLAIISYLLFRKSNYYFAENLVLSTYIISAQIILSLPLQILTIFYHNVEIIKILFNSLTVITSIYCIWVLYQFFLKYANKKIRLLLKCILVIIIYQVAQSVLVVVIILFKKHF
jgi:hypothetical protein